MGFYLRLGNQTFIEVFQGEPGAGGGIRHLALQVSDLEAFTRQVRARGGEISAPCLGADHSWQAWITDPNGIRIELHEYTDASSQLTGRKCVIA